MLSHLSFATSTYRVSFFFFFHDTAPPEISTLSLHDALPICSSDNTISASVPSSDSSLPRMISLVLTVSTKSTKSRSEEHTSELQSHSDLVCRLLLEKKK